MQKGITTRALVMLAMLVAISIVAGKYLAFNLGDFMRFSLENMPIIFAGITIGPLGGLLTGVVADLVGCLMVGYTVNPIVTLGAAAIGVISGLVPRIFRGDLGDGRLMIVVTVIISHFVGSVLIKTAGLAAYYQAPYIVLLLWRVLNYLIIGAIECAVLCTLLNSKGIKLQLAKFKEERK